MVRVVACHAGDRWFESSRTLNFFPFRFTSLVAAVIRERPQDVKEAAYKSMVRPILEYGSTVWDPHCNGLNDDLEKKGKSVQLGL